MAAEVKIVQQYLELKEYEAGELKARTKLSWWKNHHSEAKQALAASPTE
jgi:hypothetical protein